MAGGSCSKEHPTDRQCPKCGLWYSLKGIDSHKRNCSRVPDGFVMVPQHALPDGFDPSDALADAETPELLADGEEHAERPMGDGATPNGSNPSPDGSNPSPEPVETPSGEVVLPDGGEVQDLPDFSDLEEDDVDEDDQDDAADVDEATCPHCGDGFGMTPEEAAEQLAGEPGTCSDCGGEVQA
ncbi:hypothetical protein [Halomarina oriensis]|uniref:Uncharacterized protein n=1 Tax=Halomarina oriensis TaxID=671145 RepID=A0A6B0GU79_9EURY|nr:hypothetical protein [Halomarina oriensis]MWG36947.1 hypothetical protein [Halomarina oriensis]